MLFFTNDYGEGMHPELLKALAKTNMEQLQAMARTNIASSRRYLRRGSCLYPRQCSKAFCDIREAAWSVARQGKAFGRAV